MPAPLPLTATTARPLWLASWACCALLLHTSATGQPAAAANTPPPPGWEIAADGLTVTDTKNQLVWLRCVQGMRWNGQSCVGRPQLMIHSDAMALAAHRTKTEGLPWRLPRVNELRRLVDKTTNTPGPHPVLFPAAPKDWHWSGMASIKSVGINPYRYDTVLQGTTDKSADQMVLSYGWAVHLETGHARSDIAKDEFLLVRLVRPLQPHQPPSAPAR